MLFYALSRKHVTEHRVPFLPVCDYATIGGIALVAASGMSYSGQWNLHGSKHTNRTTASSLGAVSVILSPFSSEAPMNRVMFKSKLHRARVTQADLYYEGSLTIDENLMEAAD